MSWLKLNNVKVKKFKRGTPAAKALQLLHESDEVSSDGCAIVCLVGILKGRKNFYRWLEGLYDMIGDGDDNYIQLWQGEEAAEKAEFNGQPVVWDGAFGVKTDNCLYYVGYHGPSGYGGKAERYVTYADRITWMSVKPVDYYIG